MTAPRAADVARLSDAAADTPEVVLDLERVRRNVDRAAALARERGVALRPHAKTHKMPQLAELQLAAGAAGITVAKLGEAETMVDAGITDVLIGFPIVGTTKLRRFEALLDGGARIRLTVDSVEVARGIAALGRDVAVLLELDTGLGRLGYTPGPAAVEAGERIRELDGISLEGVLTHEGHVYRQAVDEGGYEALARASCRAAVEVAQALDVTTVSMGATGTFRFAAGHPGVTEVRPGTYIFNDLSQVAVGACDPDDVAAVVVATVVARPEKTRIVIDAGSKTLTSDRPNVPDAPATFGALYGADGTLVRLSEEHGVLEIPRDAPVRVGDRVAVVPNHICPVINLADAVTVVDGNVVDRWPVAARGKVQ